MKTRMFLTVAFCIAVAAFTLKPVAAIEKELTIGSKAPPLDIAHWIQNGNGFFKPVKDFAEGKVYVVEFWATWCGPCVASMPHLAEMQERYRGRGVQIVSVSDESLDEVNVLLRRENDQVGKTFEEITAAYSLTTDPDGSVHRDYMAASGQQSIPTSFIVGKSGLIEWIGHPMELDEPLEAVVSDSWDREVFKETLRAKEEFQANLQKLSQLAGKGKFGDAIKLAERELAKAKDKEMKAEWESIRYGLKLSAGDVDDEVLGYFRGRIAAMKGNASAVGQYGYQFYNLMQQGAKIGPLAADVITAIEAEIPTAESGLKPLLYNTVALLNDANGQLAAAIKAQEAAIKSSTDRQQKRLQPYLEELKEKSSAAKEGKK